ncbi:phosphatase PAP2 family protein [Longispora albida]|uniref:phosphatase PAP2 family protein n=1 Tax=Longispora albida TaxID=203523 RepID=UPI0003A21626|nr:phosphatase PAP2 family protein [Longispora albida]
MLNSGAITGLRRTLRPEECLFIGFGVLLVFLMVYTGHGYATLLGLVSDVRPAAIVLGMCLLIYGRACWRAKDLRGKERARAGLVTLGRTLREFSPLFACMAIYEALHDLTPVLRPEVVDQWLIDIDHAVFGVDVSRWLNDHIGSPLMTQFMTLCYVSYAFAPPIYAGLQYLRGRMREFRDFSLAIAITAFIGYCGYLLVPAVGPYIFQADLYPDPLPNWGHGGLMDTLNKMKGSARDAFPSLHTAMTTVVLGLMWRDARRLFWTYLPIALGLYVSTMYLRVHYAVDVAAGFATAALALFLTSRINKWWYAAGGKAAAALIPGQRRPAEDTEIARTTR